MKKIKARWMPILRVMVRDRKLNPIERLSTRVGYMGAGFLMADNGQLNLFYL